MYLYRLQDQGLSSVEFAGTTILLTQRGPRRYTSSRVDTIASTAQAADSYTQVNADVRTM
jgi:hypothetical protein